MKAEYYDLVKMRLDRVHVLTGTLHEVVEKQIPKNSITKMILLDHMDWLDDRAVVKEWHTYQKYCQPSCQYLWRSAMTTGFINPLRYLNYRVAGHANKKYGEFYDRVGTYASVYLATIPEKLLFCNSGEVVFRRSLSRDLSVAFSMLKASSFSGMPHDQFLDRYYQKQAAYYDAYRDRLLHGKRHLILSLPFFAGMTLLVQGCGTGDILEHIKDLVPQLKHIVLLDICKPLLEIAQKRVKQYGWTNVEVILGDATTYQKQVYFDMVISSYTLTMIPDWEKAVNCSYHSLSEGGHFAITDFTTESLSRFGSWFWSQWFRNNHVELSPDYTAYMKQQFALMFRVIKKGSLPLLPPFIKAPYYYSVFKKTAAVSVVFPLESEELPLA